MNPIMANKKAKLVFTDHDAAAGIEKDEDGNRYIRIKEFDMNQMHPWNKDDLERGIKANILGHPGHGKSRIIESIMLYKAHICAITQCFSGTENVNHFYRDRTTDITVFNELNLKAMEEFAKRQNIARQYLEVPWALQVLDDVTDDPSVLKKPPLGAYYKRGRHWAMIHINAAQYPMDIPPGMRSCVDYIFILANAIISEREKIYENFASGAIPSYQDFCDIMDQLTEDHTAVVIDNTSTSPNISDRVFYFRADLSRVPRDFKIGCKDAFDFQKVRADPNYVESFL
jgi:hypothetical protein